jgi:hypothetical protein
MNARWNHSARCPVYLETTVLPDDRNSHSSLAVPASDRNEAYGEDCLCRSREASPNDVLARLRTAGSPAPLRCRSRTGDNHGARDRRRQECAS